MPPVRVMALEVGAVLTSVSVTFTEEPPIVVIAPMLPVAASDVVSDTLTAPVGAAAAEPIVTVPELAARPVPCTETEVPPKMLTLPMLWVAVALTAPVSPEIVRVGTFAPV